MFGIMMHCSVKSSQGVKPRPQKPAKPAEIRDF
jgi:hypothetical protein